MAHYPWAIDGFSTFTEAMRETFDMARSTAFYRAAIGRALMAHYGKENVIAKAEEMGIAQIPQRKLRILLRAPKFFETLCMQGSARLANGDVASVGWVLQQGITELPNLIAQFAGAKTHHAPDEKEHKKALEDWKENDPFADTPLAKKHDLILGHLIMTQLELRRVLDEFVKGIKGWPKDAPDIIGLDPELQEEFGKLEGITLALFTTISEAPWCEIHYIETAAQNESQRHDDLLKLVKELDEYKEEASQKNEQEPDPES